MGQIRADGIAFHSDTGSVMAEFCLLYTESTCDFIWEKVH